MSESNWLRWAREIQMLAQAGLTWCENEHDRERYVRLQEIAAEIMTEQSNVDPPIALDFMKRETGYLTPKVDVRAAVFRDGKMLMVREALDEHRWTLPGGWADSNDTASESAAREAFEETGFEVRPTRVMAVYDRDRQGHHPPLPVSAYKIFFLCEIIGGEAKTSHETSEVRFFGRDEIPEDLSTGRITKEQIVKFFESYKDGTKDADFD